MAGCLKRADVCLALSRIRANRPNRLKTTCINCVCKINRGPPRGDCLFAF